MLLPLSLILAGLKLALTVGSFTVGGRTPFTVTEARVALAKVLPALSRNVAPAVLIQGACLEPLRAQANLSSECSRKTQGVAAFSVDHVTVVAHRVCPVAISQGEGLAETVPLGSGTVTVTGPDGTQVWLPSRLKHTWSV